MAFDDNHACLTDHIADASPLPEKLVGKSMPMIEKTPVPRTLSVASATFSVPNDRATTQSTPLIVLDKAAKIPNYINWVYVHMPSPLPLSPLVPC